MIKYPTWIKHYDSNYSNLTCFGDNSTANLKIIQIPNELIINSTKKFIISEIDSC